MESSKYDLWRIFVVPLLTVYKMFKKTNKKMRIIYLFLISALFMYGCYPGGPEYTSDYSLVMTDYDAGFDFGSRKTYFMPDTVNFATNDQDISDDVILGYEELIISQIESNMSARGYDRVDSTAADAPDLFIGVQVIAINNNGVAWIPGGGWWGGYYPPGWGWGGWGGWYYPPYYPVGYSYKTGTVLINMADPNATDVPEGDDVKIVWFGGLDGLLSSSTANNEASVKRGIDQAFDQSPYLQSNL
jgi:hypothetical protein